MRSLARVTAAGAVLVLSNCSLLSPSSGTLQVGTWGGNNAGLIVTDTSAHLHIGCTYGNVSGAIAVDMDGHFDVASSHNVSAFPVDRGVLMPARLVGERTFPWLEFRVIVSDTARDTTIVLGPVKVRFGADPQMGPCPICRTPGDAMARLSALGTAIPESARVSRRRIF
jgi:hypothetical protein